MNWRRCMSPATRRIGITTRFMLLALIIPLSACKKPDKPLFRVFASPDAAASGLLDAAKSGDQNAALALFGPESKEIIFSSDAVQDKALIDAFVASYGVMH